MLPDFAMQLSVCMLFLLYLPFLLSPASQEEVQRSTREADWSKELPGDCGHSRSEPTTTMGPVLPYIFLSDKQKVKEGQHMMKL